MELNLDNLLQYLKGKEYDAKLQKETNQIYFILSIDKTDYPVFFKIASVGELLQLLIFMPGTMKEGTASDVARLLHSINKELDVPGFGMDEVAGVIFFRIMLPTPEKKISEKLLDAYLSILKPVGQTFAPAVMTVAQGQMSYAEVQKKLKEAQKK